MLPRDSVMIANKQNSVTANAKDIALPSIFVDETQVYYFRLETKQQSKQSVALYKEDLSTNSQHYKQC